MSTYIQRVINERTELDIKMSGLELFIESSTFSNLSQTDQSLLKLQHECMDIYSRILSLRIRKQQEDAPAQGAESHALGGAA